MRFRLAIVSLALYMFSIGLYGQSSAPSGDTTTKTTSNKPSRGDLDVLSDTQGTDFGPYLKDLMHSVRFKWYDFIPTVAKPPENRKGDVDIEFDIQKDGKVEKLKISKSSEDELLDNAALKAVQTTAPFKPLPSEFKGEYLEIRMHFHYNPLLSEGRQAGS
jgi:TonB family protein